MPATITTFKTFIRPQPNVQTLMAGLASIRWWHCDYLNSFLNTFVLKEGTQLIKRPKIRPPTLNLVSRLLVGPFPNPGQIFNSNNRICCQGELNNTVADLMVEPLLKSSLTPRQPLQNLPCPTASRPCAFRGFLLERCSSFGVSIPNLCYLLAVPLVRVTGYGNVPSPKIHANNVSRFEWFWSLIFNLNMNIVGTIPVLTQLRRCWFTPFEFASLVVARIQLDMLPAFGQSKANSPVFLSKSKNPSVVVGASWFKDFDWLVLLLGSFTICSHSGASSECAASTLPGGFR